MPTTQKQARRIVGSIGVTFVLVILGLVPVLSEGGSYIAMRPPETTAGTAWHVGSTDSVAVIIAAGDIANCNSTGDELTAAVVDSLLEHATAPTWVATLGDNANPRGTERDFLDCYDRSWGRFRHVTRPVPGNHDWKNGQFFWHLPLFGNANPYFAYFSSFANQAGRSATGSYRYRHGTWDMFALGTHPERYVRRGGQVWEWLTEQLALDKTGCSLVYYHYPRFSVGKHGDDDRLTDLWTLLQQHGVDVLLAGHDHNYQRFAPQTASGSRGSAGIRQFVVGTGGDVLRSHDKPTGGVIERTIFQRHGVLKLRLYAERYTWEFVAANGVVLDSGSSPCQNNM